MTRTEILKRRLAEIDNRLAEIDEALRPRNQVKLGPMVFRQGRPSSLTSYRDSEFRQERNDLLAWKRRIERELEPTPAGDVAKAKRTTERDARIIDAAEAAQRESIEQFVEQLEREGDHRQARIWRGELLTLRERLEKQHGVIADA